MTDDTTATQEPGEGTTEQPDTTTDDHSDDPTKKARGEAANYRRRLRDAEGERDTIAAERDSLRDRVQARQRGDVEAIASQRLRDATDLWTATDLVGCLGDDGEIDPAKVTEVVEALVQQKPHYAVIRPGFDLGVRGSTEPAAKDWGDVLRGGTRYGS